MKGLLDKFWVLKIILPLILGIWLWSSLTFVIYGGAKRERLASQLEKHLIEASLRQSRKPAKNLDRVRIVTADETDSEIFPMVRKEGLKDVGIEVYADLIKAIAKDKPEAIYLSWLPEAHDSDVGYFEPLVEAAKSVPEGTRLYIVYPVAEIGILPPSLRQVATILEGDDCHYDVTSYCSYSKEWSGAWVMQVIVDQYWGDDLSKLPRYHVSTSLPHVRPNYLVNLPLRESLPQANFSDILRRPIPESYRGKLVFIGNGMVQPVDKPDRVVLRRLFSVHDDQSQGLAAGGTPYHVFWAQLAQMFIDGNTIAVPPPLFIKILVVVFCLVMLALLWLVNAPAALGFYLGMVVLLPLGNNLLVKDFNLYIPVVDLIYTGFLVFLYPAFFLMSFQLYQRWRLQALERSLSSAEALKSNFVSLVSHNLNTPVAKMQGLLEILWNSPKWQNHRLDLAVVRKEVAQLQLCVRAVLIGTSLSEGGVSESTISLKALREEFENLVGSVLRRFGVDYAVILDVEHEEDLLVPFRIDVRAVCFAIANLAALFALHKEAEILITFGIKEREGWRRSQLSISITSEKSSISPYAHRELSMPVRSREPTQDQESFFEDALVSFVHSLRLIYDGRLSLEEQESYKTIKFQLVSRPV